MGAPDPEKRATDGSPQFTCTRCLKLCFLKRLFLQPTRVISGTFHRSVTLALQTVAFKRGDELGKLEFLFKGFREELSSSRGVEPWEVIP